jgi:hypothetical protein
MDEYATPIDQIRNDMPPGDQSANQQIPANYSDLLQTMESHSQGQPQQMSNQNQMMSHGDFPPPPMVQSKIPMHSGMNPNFITHSNQPPQEQQSGTNISQLQKDFMYIVVPSILLYSTPIQNHLLRVLPSLFKDEKPSIVGNIVNASLIAFVFIALKNMKINFS